MERMLMYSTHAALKLFFIFLAVKSSYGVNAAQYDNRPNLIPLLRVGRDALEAFENKRQVGGMIMYPRVGRSAWEEQQGFLPYPRIGRNAWEEYQGFLPYPRVGRNSMELNQGFLPYPRIGRNSWESHQGFLPYPRIGRNIWEGHPGILNYPHFEESSWIGNYPRLGRKTGEFEPLDYEILLNSGNSVPKSEESLMIPRINRKKRSLTEEQKDFNDADNFSEMLKTDYAGYTWDNSEEKRASLIPRVGRSSYARTSGRNRPSLKYKHQGLFPERSGRK